MLTVEKYNKSSVEIKLIIVLLGLSSFYSLNAQKKCDFIKKIQNYQSSVEINLLTAIPTIDNSTFDLTNYLRMFDRLTISSGKKCEMFYSYHLLGGNPIIYVIPDTLNLTDYIENKINEKPELRNELKNEHEIEILRQNIMDGFVYNSSARAFNNMIPDNTDEGYFQYLFFCVMGEQFALFWHSNYYKKRIICSKKDIKGVINEYRNNELFVVDKKLLKSLSDINPSPLIKSDETKCTITWYELETHKGLYRRTYEIDRKTPFKIREINKNKLLDIRITFVY
jgi:hypothetical protein